MGIWTALSLNKYSPLILNLNLDRRPMLSLAKSGSPNNAARETGAQHCEFKKTHAINLPYGIRNATCKRDLPWRPACSPCSLTEAGAAPSRPRPRRLTVCARRRLSGAKVGVPQTCVRGPPGRALAIRCLLDGRAVSSSLLPRSSEVSLQMFDF